MKPSKVRMALVMSDQMQIGLAKLAGLELATDDAYVVVQAIAKIAEARQYFKVQRDELVAKYSQKDDDGKPVQKDGSYVLNDAKAYDQDYAALLISEVEIPRIPLSALKGQRIKPSTLGVLLQTVVSA